MSLGEQAMKLARYSAALLAFASIASSAHAQDVAATYPNQWKGFYAGVNIGGAWNSTCNSWTPNNGISNPAIATAFYNRYCPNNSTFIGGVQIGYNFQRDQLVWGFGLDYEFLSAKDRNRSLSYTGPTPPPNGTYTFSGKLSPNGFAILGPRIGYAVDNWLPFFRVGGVFTSGSHNTTASFTDASGTATFSGGKNFKANGFGVGAGAEYWLADSWLLRAEYNYVSLGKGSTSQITCTGSAATCTAFANTTLESLSNKFTASILRVGINYKF
jgi:outer membrane immunogenic protein